MKRIDRILLNALGEEAVLTNKIERHDKTCTDTSLSHSEIVMELDLEQAVVVAPETAILSISKSHNDNFNKHNTDLHLQSETAWLNDSVQNVDASCKTDVLPLDLALPCITNLKNDNFDEPLTNKIFTDAPAKAMALTNIMEQNGDVESPMATSNHTKEDSSPLRSMSPETFEIYQNLSESVLENMDKESNSTDSINLLLEFETAFIESIDASCKTDVLPLDMALPRITNLKNVDFDESLAKQNSTYVPAKALINIIEENGNVESPMAPAYSPLTPLINKDSNLKKLDLTCDHTNKDSSSLNPPESFESNQSVSESVLENINVEEKELDRPHNLQEIPNGFDYTHQQASDFSSDTDEDYVPNSHEETESDNESFHKTPKRIKVVATVHSSAKCTKRTHQSNSNVRHLSETLREKTVTRANELIDDELLVLACNSSIEASSNESNENISETLSLNESKGRPKKGRRRKNQDYTQRQRKDRKYANLPYESKHKLIGPKVFQDFNCVCHKKCHTLIPKEKRQQEFQKYISLGSYEAQLLFIVNHVKESPKMRTYTTTKGNKTGKKRPKAFNRRYYIGDIEVCREMFAKNFQISTKKIDVSLRKYRSGKAINDNRGKLQGGWNKTSEEDVNFIKNVINSLPKYESHYRREKNSNCQYLKLGMTVQKIYELYLEKLKQVYGEEKKAVAFTTLKRIFYTNFNLRCKSLKKDTCSRCDTFNNKIKNSTGNELTKLEEEREKHLKRAEDLRSKMKQDFAEARTNKHFECLTYDLEKTLPLPRIPTSIVFYKRQLWLYNCGIHVGSNDDAHCFVWLEGEAGRGAQEVGSCLINFIKNNLKPEVQHLALWSDCCGGQNRNIKIVLMLKVILNAHERLQTITFKYLESGHTFLPNDTDFSKIEAQLHYHERIYTADQYIKVMESCRKKNPLKVTRMQKTDFFSTKNIEKKIVNRKIFTNRTKTNWLQTKEILLKKEAKDSIFMKTTLNDEFLELNVKKKVKGQGQTISTNDFVLLWPNGKDIPQAKLDDLTSMFDLIPLDCMDFYTSLRGNNTITDDLEGFGGQPDFDVECSSDVE